MLRRLLALAGTALLVACGGGGSAGGTSGSVLPATAPVVASGAGAIGATNAGGAASVDGATANGAAVASGARVPVTVAYLLPASALASATINAGTQQDVPLTATAKSAPRRSASRRGRTEISGLRATLPGTSYKFVW